MIEVPGLDQQTAQNAQTVPKGALNYAAKNSTNQLATDINIQGIPVQTTGVNELTDTNLFPTEPMNVDEEGRG